MDAPLRLLLVEDSEDDAQLLMREVQRGGYEIECERVQDRKSMEQALARSPWDLIICDYTLPQFNALNALEVLHQSGHDLPFLIVSGSISEEDAVTALKAGAHDFLNKSQLARLNPAIQRELREAASRQERKQALDALVASETRLSGILNIAADAIITIDEKQNILRFNQGAEHIFGYSAKEVMGKSLDLLLPSRYIDVHDKHINQFHESNDIARRMAERRPVFGRRKDGSEFPAEGSISKLDLNGEVTYTAILRDITERKQAEAALKASEQRFRRYFELGLIGMAITSRTQGITEVNDHLCGILGFERDELQQMTWSAITHPDDLAADLGYLNQVLAGELNGYSIEKRFIRKDGQIIYANISINCVRKEDGSVDYFVALIQDITERKRSEEDLRRSNRRFRNLFENTPVAISEEDFSEVKTYLDSLREQHGQDLTTYLNDHPEIVSNCISLVKLIDVNQAALSLNQATNKAELIEGLGKTFDPETLSSFKRELLTVASGKRKLEMDVAMKTLAGEERYVTLNWAVVPGHEKDYGRVLVTFTDITKRKQRERELQAIASTNEALRTAKSLDEMLYHLLDQALGLVGAEVGSIWLYDPSTDKINRTAQRGWDEQQPTAVGKGEGIRGTVLESGKTIVSREFQSDPHASDETREAFPPGLGGACVPLRAPDQIVGVLLVNVSLPRELKEDEVHVLEALAEIGGNTIHRMRLHEQTVQQLQRLDALRAIDLAITSSIDLRVTLNILLDHVLKQLGVDAASVLLINPGTSRLEFAAAKGFLTRNIESTSLRMGEGYSGQAAFEHRTIRIDNLKESTDKSAQNRLFIGEGFVSYFGIPLVAKGEVKGVLEIFNRTQLEPNQDWMVFLETLAGQTAIALENSILFQDLQRSNFELVIAYDATIEGWSHALDLRDKETEGHTQRVTQKTLTLARTMGISEVELVHIRRGALLHDIGKMGVPDNILLKPGALTDEEWKIMRRHPQLAYDMLAPIPYLHAALDIPYSHHEKWDGTGYPRGLKGEQIPLSARIFAVVDVWDALTSDRPYRGAWSAEKALEYIKEQSGSHFDPKAVEAFLNSFPPATPKPVKKTKKS